MKKLLFNIISLSTLFYSMSMLGQHGKEAGMFKEQLFTSPSGSLSPTMFWAHYDASQRGGLYLVYDNGTKVKVISENPPDAAISSSISFLASADVMSKVNADLAVNAIKSMSELGQRNAANYMVRDIAFRIEALKNTNDGVIDTMTFKLYDQLIKSAEKICSSESKADSKKYEAQIAASNVELAKLQLAILKMKADSSSKSKVDTATAHKDATTKPKTDAASKPKAGGTTKPKTGNSTGTKTEEE